MTKVRQDITEDFYAGNSKNIRLTVLDDDEQNFSLTGCEVTYVIFDDKGAIYLVKSSSKSWQIEISAPPNSHQCIIHLLPDDTVSLSGQYRHMTNVVDLTGLEETVMTGTLNIYKQYANRFRYSSVRAYLQGV